MSWHRFGETKEYHKEILTYFSKRIICIRPESSSKKAGSPRLTSKKKTARNTKLVRQTGVNAASKECESDWNPCEMKVISDNKGT
jgi:hypothetical protein